jgi:3-phenylpropionate/trans-cinnamate dioxygenase ferredoxin reductase subunit
VIVGAGIAGSETAAHLRRIGFDGAISVISAETAPPYDRTELSKSFLRTDATAAEIRLHRPEWWAAHDVDLRCGTKVLGVSRPHRFVATEDGARLEFDQLLLATGSDAERLLFAGADLECVHVLHNLEDAERLRHQLRAARRIVVIGGGWIGAEVAAVARELGVDVTMVVRDAAPLARLLGPEVGALFARLHVENGVRVLAGRRVDTIEGYGDGALVLLTDGTTIEGDVVVLGVGVVPATHLAERVSLPLVAGGVKADASLRTPDPAIFVAGDIAAPHHPVYGMPVRSDHASPAREQGRVVAEAMLGGTGAYSSIPSASSVQYGITIELLGVHRPTDRVTVRARGGLDGMVAFWQDADLRVVGGMAVNHAGAALAITELIRARRPVAVERLRDPQWPLADL